MKFLAIYMYEKIPAAYYLQAGNSYQLRWGPTQYGLVGGQFGNFLVQLPQFQPRYLNRLKWQIEFFVRERVAP